MITLKTIRVVWKKIYDEEYDEFIETLKKHEVKE